VPIERAMELLIQRGLPTRNTTNQTEAGPSSLQLQQQRSQASRPSNSTN
jgi:hypothetical protein